MIFHARRLWRCFSFFFYGELPRGKYGGVCHVDAEKEQQCLAASLREADRHYYDLLSLKAADKAYISTAVRNSVLTNIVL